MNEDRQELTLQEQKHTVAVDSMDGSYGFSACSMRTSR